MYKSSFCGVIDELPGVSVDNFERSGEVRARAYFLSHCHSDHTQGLYSEELIRTLHETCACIYMSEPTAAIIEDEAPNKRVMKFVRILNLKPKTISLPRDDQRNFEELHLTVTPVPAGHSFGSVMFLFQTKLKTVLFTGDFRISPNELPKRIHLHNEVGPINIDALYMDTTFLNNCYMTFPQRSESVEATIEEIRKWLQNENNGVALHTSAKYGYEFVFNEISNKLGMKVYVNDSRWTLYSKLKQVVPGVTNEENTRIHVCRNYSEKKDHTNCMATIKADTKFLYIHFSAMKWNHFDIEDNSVNKISDNRLDVCFATHCSRKELIYFAKYFSPKKIVGFPEPFSLVEGTKMAERRETPAKKRKIAPKQSSGEMKVDREVLRKIFEL